MRIARFVAPGPDGAWTDPQFGVVAGELDEYGEPGEDMAVVPIKGDPLYAGVEPTGQELPLSEVRLLAPVLPRSKVIGVARNFARHAQEMGAQVPDEPLIFLKPNTSVIGPGEPILYPRQSGNVQFEGELAVVIGRICRDVPRERAGEVIFGYTIGNDVTARDLQHKDLQFTRAKGFDTFCPLGPWIETDLDPTALTIETRLNGDLKQEGTTYDMTFDVPTLIEHISAVMTLLPGDVILAGTPEGVGPMHPGDEVDVTVAGIGTLTNKVVSRD